MFLDRYVASLKDKPYTELTWAAESGNLPLVKLLIQEGFNLDRADKFDRTPLMAASSKGNLQVIRMLLDNGADVTRASRTGDTALTLSLQHWHFEAAKLLLDGCPVESRESLLLWTLRSGHHEALKFLVKSGVEPNHRLGGSEPLLFACSQCDFSTVKFLVDYGADLNFCGRGFPTPLKVVATLGDFKLAKFLLWQGAEIDARLISGNAVSMPERLYRDLAEPLRLGVSDINPLRCITWTPLMGAAAMGHHETVGLLVNCGADLNLCDGEGRTALMIAAKRGHSRVAKALIDAGANNKVTDKDGKSALDHANENGHPEVAAVLGK